MKLFHLALGSSLLFACGAPAHTTEGPATTQASTTTITSASTDDSTAKREQTRRASRALTVMDQGDSLAERHITMNVRQLLMSDQTLSFRAKNVRVITIGSKVTLLGEVVSREERATVETYAMRTPGVSEVDDRLQVAE